MKKRLLSLLALSALLLAPPEMLAKESDLDSPTEGVTVLDPYEVKANPFAGWGIGISEKLSLWHRATDGPPSRLFVAFVASHSPADLAGVQIGDEITAVNGAAITAQRRSALIQQYKNTERDALIRLELLDRATNQKRVVELTLVSNRTWQRNDSRLTGNFWGLRALLLESKLIKGSTFFVLKRIVGREAVQVVHPRAPKSKRVRSKQKPIYIIRRAVVLKWAKRSLTLIERENRIVEVIEADKVPKDDEVVGRLMHEGATLTLNADGTYELQDAPPKP